MVEVLLGGFWAASYLLIVIFSIAYHSEKKVFMPLISGMLNFGWEIFALRTSGGYWVHIVWLLLDCIILAYNIFILDGFKKKLTYALMTAACIPLLYFVFQTSFFDGMLISSFVIDIIMALEYLLFAKWLSGRGQIAIGVFRLLGDFFAWYGNRRFSKFVLVAGMIVLALNLAYVATCFFIQEKQIAKPKPKSKAKKNQKKRKKK